MASVNKKIRSKEKRAAQAMRSDRNKAARVTRNRKIREVSQRNKENKVNNNPEVNNNLTPYKRSKLNNRLRRLQRFMKARERAKYGRYEPEEIHPSDKLRWAERIRQIVILLGLENSEQPALAT